MDSVSEHEDKFRVLAERRIRDAIELGELRTRTGADQQLDLEENPYAPEDWRLALHILKSNHYRPDWMELAEEIEQDIAAWRRAADTHFAFVRARLAAVAGNPRAITRLREEVATLKARHARATAFHAAQSAEINRKIHRYNATVPAPSLMRGTIAPDDEMRRFAERLPAFLTY